MPVDTWGCVGKESYETKALADRVGRRRKKSGKRVVVYHCQFCQIMAVMTRAARKAGKTAH